ncbi:MAG: DNA polymerase III subunit gamma/tau, partial [Lachnospiraceae bacterium]|nr:DNA polymerase III subunit gamma/tau [Lachnospiraceae bacterium]
FNAMLKTLEEPPEYVIFILATTEVHKLPITVLSRCQRYDFRRISIDTIADRLRELMEKENVKVEDKAIRYIAKTADGSLRDALSLLDQCIAFHLGEELTYDMALDVLGAVDTEVFSRLLRSCIDGDVHSAIELLDEVITQGRELTQFIIDFTWYLRNLMLVQTSDGLEDVIDMSSDNLARLKEEAALAKREQIIRYIHIFSELANQIKYASQKRVLVEIALIRLCKPAMDQDNAAILGRIDEMEKKLSEGAFVAAPIEGTAQRPVSEPVHKAQLPKSIPDDVKKIVANWKKLIGNFSNDLPIASALERAKPSLDGAGNLLIRFDAGDLSSERLISEPGHSKLSQALNDISGKEIVFSVNEAASSEEYESGTVDLREFIKTEIYEED